MLFVIQQTLVLGVALATPIHLASHSSVDRSQTTQVSTTNARGKCAHIRKVEPAEPELADMLPWPKKKTGTLQTEQQPAELADMLPWPKKKAGTLQTEQQSAELADMLPWPKKKAGSQNRADKNVPDNPLLRV